MLVKCKDIILSDQYLLSPRNLRRRCPAAHLLLLWIRIPPGAWISVSLDCGVLSGRDVCNGPIPSAEKSYQM